MNQRESQNNLKYSFLEQQRSKIEYALSRYKLWVVAFLLGITFFYILNSIYYPDTPLIPEAFLLGFFLIGMTFLWFQEMRDRVLLQNINALLVELDQMKTRFMMIAGHELYTPLAIIKQYTDLMKERMLGELSGEQDKSLGSINRAIERLYRIVKQVLVIEDSTLRSEHKLGTTVRWETFDLAELGEMIQKDMGPLFERRKQTFKIDIDNQCKDMFAHKERIYQVMSNIVLNAIRFTPDGGTITLHAAETPDEYMIGIRDTGIGIPASEKDRIFESFYESKEPEHHSFGTVEFKSSGLGLGLTICKSIVEAHKGKIWFNSEVGKFSDFVFTIPKIHPEKRQKVLEEKKLPKIMQWTHFKKSA